MSRQTTDSPRSARADLAVAAAFLLIAFALASALGLGEAWFAWASAHGGWALDAVPLAPAFGGLALAWYAHRRRRSSVQALQQEIAANRALESALSALKQSDQTLRDSEGLLRDAIESISEGFIVYDADERLVLWNRRYTELYPEIAKFLEPGMRLEEVLRRAGERGQSLDAVADFDSWLKGRLEAYRRGRGAQEFSIRDDRWVRASERKTQGGGIVGIRTDITDRKKAEDTIWTMAHKDSLTGLSNRQLFLDRLKEAVGNAERLDRLVGVMFLDIDRFKEINDGFGHPIGDAYLKSVARQLQGLVRKTDTVARLGGDEFAIILTNLTGTEAVHSMAMRIIDRIAQPQNIEGCYLTSSTSIGISLYPLDDRDCDELVRKADLALYQAKADGRGCYHVYDDALHRKIKERATLEQELQRAVVRGEFVLHYQPQVCIRSGNTVGAEALIRWQHPERGLIAPSEWIPIVEASGLIIEIGAWALQHTCAQNKAWQIAGLPEIRVAVNIAGVQFQSDDFAPTVETALRQSELAPQWLELEITESMVIEGVAEVTERLRRLNGLGVEMAIDDFGTGYSSLARLKHFPVHRLKIDRSFVQSIDSDANDGAITEAVITLGHSLGLKVIAEGVETKEQLAFLSSRGCDEAQGFYFGRPMPAADFAEWLSLRPRSDAGSEAADLGAPSACTNRR